MCFATQPLGGCNEAAENNNMKIYLLLILIGVLFTAIHFTSTQDQQPESLPQ
jgi:hypothetical protein